MTGKYLEKRGNRTACLLLPHDNTFIEYGLSHDHLNCAFGKINVPRDTGWSFLFKY